MAIANTPSLNISIRRACKGRQYPRMRNWLLPAALATVYVVWGSTYLAIRVMVETMPPLLAAGVRFGLAGGLYLAVLRVATGPARLRVSRRQLAAAGLVGILLPFGGNGPVAVAEQGLPAP